MELTALTFDQAVAERILRQHANGSRDWAFLFVTHLLLALWLEQSGVRL